MPRSDITITTLSPGSATSSTPISFTTAPAGNPGAGLQVNADEDIILLAEVSSGAIGNRTITVKSVPEPRFGRSGDLTSGNLSASDFVVIGRLAKVGFAQPDGKVYIDIGGGENSDVSFAAIKLVK